MSAEPGLVGFWTSQVTGRITKIHFTDGADVKTGDVLCTIDPRPYQAQLDAAEANLANAKAALALAKSQLARYESVTDQRAVTRQDYDTKKNAVETNEAQVKQNQAAVETARLNLEYCTIRSPINGRAGQRLVDLGNVVTVNTSALLSIQRLDPIYESYLHPLTVLSTLPTALVGGLLTLYLCGEQASLYAFVGMFMLMGIVKKNGIMIVDFAIQRVTTGASAVHAIHDASLDRFRPILMTTLAAVIGAVPIAMGFGADGTARRPLGLVIVGGLVVSQFITLYITPVIYLYLEQFQAQVLDRTAFFRSGHSRRPTVDVSAATASVSQL